MSSNNTPSCRKGMVQGDYLMFYMKCNFTFCNENTISCNMLDALNPNRDKVSVCIKQFGILLGLWNVYSCRKIKNDQFVY